ncbi:MAG: hypothetical protein IT384_03555 [Deltaproteobacteria bacterium]|nr:hypothetical protein [Deltaproteobacteria bacterium]
MKSTQLIELCVALFLGACGGSSRDEEGVGAGAILYDRAPEGFAVTTAGGAPIGLPIATDSSHVFWFDEQGGYLAPEGPIFVRSKLAHSSPRALVDRTYAASTTCKRFASDGVSFFWFDNVIRKASKRGGAPIAVTSTSTWVSAIALDLTHVYFTNDQAIQRVPKGGGRVETIATGEAIRAALAVDEGFVYFADDAAASLARVPKDGGALETIALGVTGVGDIEVDGTSVYWSVPSAGLVATVWKRWAGAPTILAAEMPRDDGWELLDIAVDALNVYYERPATNELMRVSKWGGSRRVLASPSSLGFLTVDSTHVYWSEDGAVVRIRK